MGLSMDRNDRRAHYVAQRLARATYPERGLPGGVRVAGLLWGRGRRRRLLALARNLLEVEAR